MVDTLRSDRSGEVIAAARAIAKIGADHRLSNSELMAAVFRSMDERPKAEPSLAEFFAPARAPVDLDTLDNAHLQRRHLDLRVGALVPAYEGDADHRQFAFGMIERPAGSWSAADRARVVALLWEVAPF